MLTCPKCRRRQYFVCGNPDCVCQGRVPKGKLPQMWTDDGNGLSCPYCGFTAHADFWEEREMEAFIRSEQSHSLSEAVIKRQQRLTGVQAGVAI